MKHEENAEAVVGQEEEAFVERPGSKPDKAVRGRLYRWLDSDYTEFHPEQKRETAARTMIAATRNVKFYKNEGEKENSFSVLCNVPGDSVDPAATALELISGMLSKHMQQEPKISVSNFIHHSEGLKIWRNKKKHQLHCYLELDTKLNATMLSMRVLDQMTVLHKVITSGEYKK
jgi:hypothetical protein